jgi:dimethylamine/trimethylamine dehydrogenase
VRCTQNATIGEEWRKNWHPEKFEPKKSDDKVLVVGSGPAGLEAGLIAARRGYEVTIAEKSHQLGGRLNFEESLPGLRAWGRLKDYRLYALKQMANVSLYPDSELGIDEILSSEHQRIVIATGARWTRSLYSPLEIPIGRLDGDEIYTPDDIAAGNLPNGKVLVFDFDNYYMGGVIAEYLSEQGNKVEYATPAGHASAWTIMTNEQPYVHQALFNHGIEVHTQMLLENYIDGSASMKNIFTSEAREIDVDSVVIVGLRLPENKLFDQLLAENDAVQAGGIKSVDRIGDALAAGALVHAVYSGHEYARNLDTTDQDRVLLRDLPIVEIEPRRIT